MDKIFIFDYDDTLAWNQHDYCYVQIEFQKWVIDRLGPKAPNAHKILNMEVEIDLELIKTMGFQMERFPTSLRDTYRKICRGAGIDDPAGAEEAYKIGMHAFDEEKYRQQGLIQGAAETLDFLVAQHDELVLLTKGDERVQRLKIDANNLARWFGDRMHIVATKNAQVIRETVGGRDPSRVWHVGNSIRSDVHPALEAGIGMVYIPCETWAFEMKHNGVPESNRLVTFGKITDIRDNYHLL